MQREHKIQSETREGVDSSKVLYNICLAVDKMSGSVTRQKLIRHISASCVVIHAVISCSRGDSQSRKCCHILHQ